MLVYAFLKLLEIGSTFFRSWPDRPSGEGEPWAGRVVGGWQAWHVFIPCQRSGLRQLLAVKAIVEAPLPQGPVTIILVRAL